MPSEAEAVRFLLVQVGQTRRQKFLIGFANPTGNHPALMDFPFEMRLDTDTKFLQSAEWEFIFISSNDVLMFSTETAIFMISSTGIG